LSSIEVYNTYVSLIQQGREKGILWVRREWSWKWESWWSEEEESRSRREWSEERRESVRWEYATTHQVWQEFSEEERRK
jgi:hypothetical protein